MADKASNKTAAVQLLSKYWHLLVVSGLFVFVQWPNFVAWWKVWNENDSYYSHGPLVPIMALFMVWMHRKRIAGVQTKPCWAGYLLLLASVGLFVVGNWTLSATIYAVAFVSMILGIILSLFGTRITWLLIVPVLFLFSMTPIAQSKLDSYTASMQWKSASLASKILTITGYDSTLNGSTITAEGLPEPLRVAAECSGLKTLISLISFTVFLIYISNAALWKKCFLLAISFPLSLFINSLRIAMIGYAGAWTDSAEAMHKFHNNSGYLGLVICFFLLFGLASLLKVKIGEQPDGEGNEGTYVQKQPVTAFRFLPAIIVSAMLIIAALSSYNSSPIYPQSKGNIPRANIPASFGVWTGRDQQIDKVSLDILKGGDLFSRNYSDDAEERTVNVFLTASRMPSGFHDPHICLPGGGNLIIGEETIKMQIEKPYSGTITARLLHTSNDYGESLVLYWYMSGRNTMPLTSDAQNAIQLNLRADLRNLIMNPQKNHEITQNAEKRQIIWYRFSTQINSDKETDLKELQAFVCQFVANVKGFGSF